MLIKFIIHLHKVHKSRNQSRWIRSSRIYNLKLVWDFTEAARNLDNSRSGYSDQNKIKGELISLIWTAS